MIANELIKSNECINEMIALFTLISYYH